jgi:VanZ family protein
MKISTQSPSTHSATAERKDTFRKAILAVLFVCLAITALADAVQLFQQVSEVKTLPLGIVYR